MTLTTQGNESQGNQEERTTTATTATTTATTATTTTTTPRPLAPLPEHGKSTTYKKYKCRCDACRKASNAANLKSKRLNQPGKLRPPGHGDGKREHGTDLGYSYYNCRCMLCKAAHARANMERNHRRKLKTKEKTKTN